eukprot:CAMPEP_0206511618 /NCGR_PEP_ID=MMETSP0324_2-20121206/60386_1 /ASSEMBLY_ACC=CAM_ASM_000836 /TAXON_ID=2866 /ORGANISM="Crypthecodinium cohnii, Strain Seligo" /LENGTH=59 /DNA_ID=CAMNT_0054003409 /DNA_START=615 /DNA_END=791 /DNA_ORIENTATION=+
MTSLALPETALWKVCADIWWMWAGGYASPPSSAEAPNPSPSMTMMNCNCEFGWEPKPEN